MTDPEILTAIGAILFLLFMSALFSGSETALTAASRARLYALESEGDKRAAQANALIRNRERLIGTILIGNNFVNILAATLNSMLFARLFGSGGLAVAAATAVMTVTIVIFSEIAPKTAAIKRPDAIAIAIAPVMRWLVVLLSPVTHVLDFIVRGILSLVGMSITRGDRLFTAAEELRGAVEMHHEEGSLDRGARDLVRGALDLDEIRVDEIMVHRKSIQMLDLDQPTADIIAAALKSQHTRLPLYRETTDNIVGILHAKDLLRAIWDSEGEVEKIRIADMARPPYFAPETTTLQEQLDTFKRKQEQLALVVDEYGSIKGLVTLEDILEEIVGEIEDEHDEPVQGVRPQPDGSINVDGDVTIRDLNRAMDWDLPDAEAVTIAGLVIHEAQSIPDVGRTFAFHGFRFRTLRRRRNQITAIKIPPVETAAATGQAKDTPTG